MIELTEALPKIFWEMSLAGLDRDYVEWTLRSEYSRSRVQITWDTETCKAIGCLVTQWPGDGGPVKILTAWAKRGPH